MNKIESGNPRRLNVEDIVAASRAATGLAEMGEPDIREGLAVLLDSLAHEARLRPTGIESQRSSLIGFLSHRLRIHDTFTRHPEILNEPIRGPIVIIGLPRSGTTKMQRAMAATGDLQYLPLWRILNPTSIGPTPPGGVDPRIAAAEQVSTTMREYFPDFFAGHPMLAHEADEEIFMAELVMRGWNPCYMAHTPSFEAWLKRQDFHIWYVFLRKMLQFFQWQDGSLQQPWLLKAPEHMPHIDDLFKVFPDAIVVHCHRDPAVSIASLAVLNVASRQMYSDDTPPEESGQFIIDHWSQHTREYLAQREQLEQKHRFVDVAYREIANDVLSPVARIFDVAKLDLSDAARARIRHWETDNPPYKQGVFYYSLEQVGLTEEQVRRGFAGYIERFSHLC